MFEDLKDFLKNQIEDFKEESKARKKKVPLTLRRAHQIIQWKYWAEDPKKLWLEKRDFVKHLRGKLQEAYDSIHASFLNALDEKSYLPDELKVVLLKSPFDWVEKNFIDNIDLQKSIFKSFLNPKYKPPSSFDPLNRTDIPLPSKDLLYHLHFLEIYYSHLVKDIPSIITERIDLVMARLTYITLAIILSYHYDDQATFSSTFKGMKTILSNKKKRTQIVMDVYHKMSLNDIKRKMTYTGMLNKIADDIENKRKELSKEEQKKYPIKNRLDRKTVERCLFADKKIETAINHFKKMKFFKVKRRV